MKLSKSLVAEVLPEITFAVLSGATSADVSGAVVVVVSESLSDTVFLIFSKHEVSVPTAIRAIDKYNFTIREYVRLLMCRGGFLGEIISIHIEDHGDVFREGGFFENGLDVVGEGAGLVGAEGDLEAELIVRFDQGAG